MRLFVVMLVMAVAASTQAMAFGSHGRMTKKTEVNEGCPAYYYRGVGGNCVQGDGSRVYRATTRLARNIPRAVALSKKGWVSVHQRQAARGAVSPMKKANGPADLQLL